MSHVPRSLIISFDGTLWHHMYCNFFNSPAHTFVTSEILRAIIACAFGTIELTRSFEVKLLYSEQFTRDFTTHVFCCCSNQKIAICLVLLIIIAIATDGNTHHNSTHLSIVEYVVIHIVESFVFVLIFCFCFSITIIQMKAKRVYDFLFYFSFQFRE